MIRIIHLVLKRRVFTSIHKEERMKGSHQYPLLVVLFGLLIVSTASAESPLRRVVMSGTARSVATANAEHSNLPPTRGIVVNLVEWDGGELPAVYERTAQLPFTREDVLQLVQSGFEPDQIALMISERRYAGDASAEGLIALKRAGFAPVVIQAISKHALAPNQSLTFTVYLTFDGTSQTARHRFLYVIIPDGEIERVFTADLNTVLAGQWQRDALIDATDPLLPRKIRRVTFSGTVPLKTHGDKTVRIFTSSRPGVYGIHEIPKTDLARVQTYAMHYPVSSPIQDCRAYIRYKQDVMLPDKWHMNAARMECEWR